MAKTPAPTAAPVKAATPVAPVAPAAEPEKQKRQVFILHPALWDAAADKGKGAPVKIDAVPEDYSPGKHKPLRKADFNDEAVYFDYQAFRFQKKANNALASARQSRLLGQTAASGNAKKLVKMMSRIAELRALCEADGVDVASIDAMLGSNADEAPEGDTEE